MARLMASKVACCCAAVRPGLRDAPAGARSLHPRWIIFFISGDVGELQHTPPPRNIQTDDEFGVNRTRECLDKSIFLASKGKGGVLGEKGS